jgi:hypothetical protein
MSKSKLFQVHLLNEQGIEKAKELAVAFDALYDRLETLVGAVGVNTREFSIVKTQLETASFYAKKAMASQAENQKSIP